MTAYVSTKVLLQHMQGMRSDLQMQIDRISKKMDQGFAEMRAGFMEMRSGFEDARQHRQALQEDLYETMRVQGRHTKKLARL